MDNIQKILDSQNYDQKSYEKIIWFIMSYEIRTGELKINNFVIDKVNRSNFILYLEYENQKGEVEILYALSAYRHVLLDAINKHAKNIGLIIIEISHLNL